MALEIDGAALGTWTAQPDLGGLRGVPLPPAFISSLRPATHGIRVTGAGAVASASAASGAIDIDKLLDVLVVVWYKL